MNKENVYILNKDQIEVLGYVHERIILDGLMELELEHAVEKEIVSNAKKNFNKMIETAQKILTGHGANNEIRLEIQAEALEEKRLKELEKQKDLNNKKHE